MPEEDEITSLDQSKRAEAILQHIIQTDLPAINADGEIVPEKRVTVNEAMVSRPVLDQETGRNRARVLFVTTDQNVFLADSSIRRYYTELANQFDELHVFCLVPLSGEEILDRASNNLWFYQIRSNNWWQLPWEAVDAAKDTMTWNNIIRPDIVIGVDPFEAGLAAYLIAKKFRRPLQLHLYTNPFKDDFAKQQVDNNWRLMMAKFVLKRVRSVRTSTSILQAFIAKKYRKIKDLATLPRFYNFTGLMTTAPVLDLHQIYPSYTFIILAMGPLSADSPLHDLFTANHNLFKNPNIGLVVIGDGPAKGLFEEKVKLLGIEKSVVFKKTAEDLNSYLKTADLFVEMGTDEDSEIRVLQASAAGLSLVAITTDLRADLFKDGESALLCPANDLNCINQKTSKFINNIGIRKQIALNAQDIARERLHEDPLTYYQATAISIESILSAK